jgi:hypothetical protein
VPSAPEGWLVDVVRGATDPVQGWVSVESGRREPAPVVRYRREADLPVRFAFLLAVGPVDGPAPRLARPKGPTRRCISARPVAAEIAIDADGARVEHRARVLGAT